MNYDQLSLDLHRQFGGKISLKLRDDSELTREKLSAYYTPGVAAVSRKIVNHPEEYSRLTWVNNLVAVISDGSAVLGLGDVGPRAAMPVMEGKALLFKHFADVDAVPIVLDVHTADEIVSAVKAIAPSFGAINLEDIAAPKCFEVENRLKSELDIPVMHDDQHGTAIVVLAGLINACNVILSEAEGSFSAKDCSVDARNDVARERLNQMHAVFSGVGAAGIATMRLLKLYAPNLRITAVDSRGAISNLRDDLNPIKNQLLKEGTISNDVSGDLADVIRDANIFIGVSAPGILSAEMIRSMAPNPIIFAIANPDPEIMPDIAKSAGAAIVATGRSDFPNQVNNALAFPGIFRGALDHGVKKITDEHKVAAARAIASLVENPTAEEIIPSVFAAGLVEAVAAVIK